MKPRLVLLDTQDGNLNRLLSEAPFEARTRAARARGAIVLIARRTGNALQATSIRCRTMPSAIHIK
jgi:hypothetical protein